MQERNYFVRKLGSLKKYNEKSKPGLELLLETPRKNLQKQAKMIKQRKVAGICRNTKEKATQENNNSK